MRGLNILSVSQLNAFVKSMIEGEPRLQEVYIKGEISNYTDHYRSGHAYFTLKDETASLKAVLFRRYREQLNFLPQDGMRVIVRGQISVYERDGVYQLYAWEIQPDGIGALHLAFEQLKAKLSAEGLFDAQRKRPLPRYPECIGVITSPTGAVIQDIYNVISRRYPCVKLLVYPVSVQGAQAVGQICRALTQANAQASCDLLILARGGGSLEDLWPFNDEKLARAIAASRLPVVSAVGHETDYTIADFVADLRAPTPSAAAELVTPNREQLLPALRGTDVYLQEQIRARLQREGQRLMAFQESTQQLLRQRVEKEQRRLLSLDTALYENGIRLIQRKRHRLELSAAKLTAINPMGVLARGYTITMSGKRLLTTAQGIVPGQKLRTRFRDGEVCSVVETVHNAVPEAIPE